MRYCPVIAQEQNEWTRTGSNELGVQLLEKRKKKNERETSQTYHQIIKWTENGADYVRLVCFLMRKFGKRNDTQTFKQPNRNEFYQEQKQNTKYDKQLIKYEG